MDETKVLVPILQELQTRGKTVIKEDAKGVLWGITQSVSIVRLLMWSGFVSEEAMPGLGFGALVQGG